MSVNNIKKEFENILYDELKKKVKKVLGHSRFTFIKKGDKITIGNITDEENEKVQAMLKK